MSGSSIGKVMLTPAEYARHRSVSRPAVSKAIAAGRIQIERGRIDRDSADRAWVESSARAASGDGAADPDGTEGGRGPSLNRAQTLLTLERAGIARLDRLEREGKIRRQQEAAAAIHARQFIEALEAFPSRLTPRIAVGVSRAEYLRVERVIREECRRLLEDLARAPAEETT